MEHIYVKDFDAWNQYSKTINEQQYTRLFHEREVWWCVLGVNIGSEQDGKNELFERPILIIKRIHADLFLGMPLTSKLSSHKDRVTAYVAGEDS